MPLAALLVGREGDGGGLELEACLIPHADKPNYESLDEFCASRELVERAGSGRFRAFPLLRVRNRPESLRVSSAYKNARQTKVGPKQAVTDEKHRRETLGACS